MKLIAIPAIEYVYIENIAEWVSFFPVITTVENKVEIWGFKREDNNEDKITVEIPVNDNGEIDKFCNALKLFSEKYYGVNEFNKKMLEIKISNKNEKIEGSSWNVAAFLGILKVLLGDEKNLFIATGSLKAKNGNVIVGKVESEDEKLKGMKEFKRYLKNKFNNGQIHHILVPDPKKCVLPSSQIQKIQSKEELTIEDLVALFLDKGNIDDVLNNKKIRKVFDYIYFKWLKGVKPSPTINPSKNINIADISISELKAKKNNSIFKSFEIEIETRTREYIYENYFKNPICKNNRPYLEDFRIFGPGGVGKTTFILYIYNEILKLIEENYKVRVLPILLQSQEYKILSQFSEDDEKKRKEIIKLPSYNDNISFLVLADGLDETSFGIEDIKGKISNILEGNIYFVFSSRENIALSPTQAEEIIGFRIEGISNIEEFIEKNFNNIKEKISILLKNPQLYEVLHIPFYLSKVISLIRENKLNASEIKFPHQIVLRFIIEEFNNSWEKNFSSFKGNEFKIAFLSVLGFLAFRMLKEKYSKDFDELKKEESERPLTISYDQDGYYEIEYNGSLEYIYEECRNKRESPKATYSILCNLLHSLSCSIVKESDIELDDFINECDEFLKLENLQKSGFLIVNNNNIVSFSHRIIHESFISLFLSIVFLYLRDKDNWIEAIKKFARYEPTNIPGDIDNFEYLAQVVSWIELLCDEWDKDTKIEEYIELFDPNSEEKIKDIMSENDTFNYVRLSRIIKYLH